MTMNKFFTGLIALMAGVALSAGSAFATKGVMAGDPAMMKLVPYYETGDTKATIIGVQNLSPQEQTTMDLHGKVTAAQTRLDGDDGADRNETARLEGNLADAMDAIYTEHVFVAVGVFDDMGMMMGSATLCLAEHQFGYVVLQGPSSDMMDYNQGAVLSAMDGDISAYGYVQVMAEDRKFTGCGAAAPNTLMNVDTRTTAQLPGGDDATDNPDPTSKGANSQLAAWTIIQDVGDGFFGTEVPTSTISMASATSARADAEGVFSLADLDTHFMLDAELACYEIPNNETGSTTADQLTPTAAPEDADAPPGVIPGKVPYTEGTFMQGRCGLVPERHFRRVYTSTEADALDDALGVSAGDLKTTGVVDTVGDSSTPNGHAFARYDAGDDSMIVVWLADGMDDPAGKPSARRMIHAAIECEDGTVVKDMDIDGNPVNIQIPAPTMVTMIDPNGDTLSEFTDMCAGDRGVVKMYMPSGSRAGAVFSHITQMGGHYRMNFPGYNMASDVEIEGTVAP